jgi:magnesium transporter
MHIVPAIGGVLGNQTVAIMVREIVLGNLDWKRSRKILAKEMAVGLGSGIAIGLISSVISAIIFKNWVVGLVFGGAIVFNFFNAALMGIIVPMVLRRFRLDPALASGMIVTLLTDVFGLFVFLGMATLFLV